MNEKIEALQRSVEDVAKRLETIRAGVTPDKLEAVRKELVTECETLFSSKAELEAMAKDIAEQREMLRLNYGKSGAEDWKEIVNKWIHGMYQHKRFGKVPDYITKDANLADYDWDVGFDKYSTVMTTTTDATAGYLAPTLVLNAVYETKDLYGNILPLLTKIQSPAGVSINCPRDLVQSTATYKGQGVALAEPGQTFMADTCVPTIIGNMTPIANELLASPGASVVDVFVNRLIRGVVRGEETAIIASNQGGSEPHKGILNATSVNDQTNIADDTHEKLTLFITESLVDAELLYRKEDSVIITHPTKWRAVKADAIADSSWGVNLLDPHAELFEGYRVLPHPACKISTTYWAAMFMPSEIYYVSSGMIAADVNPLGTGWSANVSELRVFTHSDWGIGVPAHYSKADYT